MNKPLSEVTEADARTILQASTSYTAFFLTGRWELTDESKGVKEPCKKFTGKTKRYIFWFFSDRMVVDDKEGSWPDLGYAYDVRLDCYLKAIELGYYVPKLSEMLKLNK